jgi:hypothetical protein
MSTKISDFANNIFFTSAVNQTAALATTSTGIAIDMSTVANNNCFALQAVGTVAGTSITFAGKIQEATTATGTYSDISGATFTALTSTTGSNIVQIINFQRTLQFCRFLGVIGGTTSTVALDAFIGGQKGQVGN